MYHNTGDNIAVLSLMKDVVGEKVENVECFVEETIEILVSQMMEEKNEAVKHALQEQEQRITVEQIVDVPLQQIRMDTHEVNQLIIQERNSGHVDEHNVHIPSNYFPEATMDQSCRQKNSSAPASAVYAAAAPVVEYSSPAPVVRYGAPTPGQYAAPVTYVQHRR